MVEKASGAPGQQVASREDAHAVASQIIGDDRTDRKRTPAMNVPYWSKRTLGYCGQQLDRGQVFRLKSDALNNRLLIDIGYVAVVPEDATLFPCRVCGKEFIDQGMLAGHGKARHESREFVPPPPPVKGPNEAADAYQNRLDEWALMAGRAAEAAEDKAAKREDDVAPLDLTKTTASREA